MYINISCICKNNTVSYKVWSATIRINKGELLIMKLSHGLLSFRKKHFKHIFLLILKE